MKYEHNFWIVRQNMDWAHYDHMYKDEDIHESLSSNKNFWIQTNRRKHIHSSILICEYHMQSTDGNIEYEDRHKFS